MRLPDFNDREACIAYAAYLATRYPDYPQYVTRSPGRLNYNITMRPVDGTVVVWSSN